MPGKFDFIIKILESEKERQVGKAVLDVARKSPHILPYFKYKTEKIKALDEAIELLTENNKQR